MKRTLALASLIVFLPLAALGWALIVSKFEIAKNYDIQYIGKHCPNAIITTGKIENHITYDGGVSALYIYDRVPGEFSSEDFEAAYSDIFREVFCAPYLGCLFPPSMRGGCFS